MEQPEVSQPEGMPSGFEQPLEVETPAESEELME
jgi:hypothetical protein